jgi:hypothetical protein
MRGCSLEDVVTIWRPQLDGVESVESFKGSYPRFIPPHQACCPNRTGHEDMGGIRVLSRKREDESLGVEPLAVTPQRRMISCAAPELGAGKIKRE